MVYVAGFEGGGSTARLAIATMDGEIIFRKDAQGVNAIDNPDWQAEYEKLFTAAGDNMRHVQSACFGIPGWGEIAQIDAMVSAWLHARLGCHIRIMNDVELSHRAFFADKAGVLLLSGTGSMALGRTKEGEFIRVGGFGHILGDEGSAYWLGQQALTRLARESDGRNEKSAFGEALSQRLGINLSLEGIMDWFHAGSHRRSHIATISAILDDMAEMGDLVAKTLLIDGAQELYEAYQAVHRRLEQFLKSENRFSDKNFGKTQRLEQCVEPNETKTALEGQEQIRGWAMAGSTFHSKTLARAVRNLIGYDSTQPAQSALDKALQIARQEIPS